MMVTTLAKGLFSMVALFGLQGCGCTLIGCVNGLDVQLPSLPTTPFQVELLVAGVVQTAPAAATCDGASPCQQRIHFYTSATDQITIRVTTPNGVRTTAFPHVTYGKSYPNGD